jgi:hypothetical protein
MRRSHRAAALSTADLGAVPRLLDSSLHGNSTFLLFACCPCALGVGGGCFCQILLLR